MSGLGVGTVEQGGGAQVQPVVLPFDDGFQASHDFAGATAGGAAGLQVAGRPVAVFAQGLQVGHDGFSGVGEGNGSGTGERGTDQGPGAAKVWTAVRAASRTGSVST